MPSLTFCAFIIGLKIQTIWELSIKKSIFYFSLYITLFQIALGYFQMLSRSSFQSINPFVYHESIGDAFTGTLTGSGLGAFAAIKVSLTFMLYFPFLIAKMNFKVIFIFLILLIGWILPSAVFSLICGFTAIFLYFVFDHFKKYILRFKIKPSFIYMLIVSILVFSFFAYLQPRNKVLLFSNIKQIYSTIKEQNTGLKTRKIIYYKNTLFKLPKEFPVMLLIGVGPGNYSSRSAWIVSGVYLLKQHKFIKVTPSKIASNYNIKLWNRDLRTETFKGAGSIVHQPFSTWFSIFAETGIIGILIFFLLMKYFYRSFILARKLYNDPFMNSIASGLLISLIYIVILFIVENLFEYPQVMGQFFVFSCVLIKIIESKVKNARLNNSYYPKF